MRSTFSLFAAAVAGSLVTLLLSHAVPARAGDAPAAAAPAPAPAGTCAQYSVVTWSASQLKALGTDQFKRLAPEGWEPFASYQNISNGNAMFAFRRCGAP